MRVTILGVKRREFKGSDGKMKTAVDVCGVKDYTRYEQETSDCEGQDVVKEYSSIDYDLHPGDVAEFYYEPGFKDKATLVDIQVISHADNPFPEKKEDTPEKAAAGSKDTAKAGAGA